MPALSNHRQERFCQLVKQGIPPLRAYPAAGYNEHESAPYRLCGNVRIKARIAEITRAIAMKTQVTVASITEELEEARQLAAETKQPSAMATATVAKAKLHGLMIDRHESGEPGAFGDKDDVVLARVAAELGADAAADLARALERGPAADVPLPDDPSPSTLPLPSTGGNDTLN